MGMELMDDARNLIDARGEYVSLVLEDIRHRLAQPGLPYLVTIVDNQADRDMVVAVASDLNLPYKVYAEEPNYYIRIDKDEMTSLPKEFGSDFSQILLVTSNSLGEGEYSLGCDLMASFLSQLPHSETLPQAIIFANSGVFFVCEGSAALRELMDLESRNVGIYACSRSLEYYGLKEKQCVGSPIKTFTMVNYLLAAFKVLTLG